MDNISELERLISIRIMQEDAETIFTLLSSERDSIFAMEIIPYYALFVQSCQEYVGENFLPQEIALSIKDIHNHIKYYAESFGKSKRRVASIDQAQDANFKSRLRFNFLENWNIHLNLGTYWTEDYHIIGNTQQLAAFIGAKDLSDPEAGKKQYDLGYQIGSFVSSVRSGLSASLGQPVVARTAKAITIKSYYDINTNKHNNYCSRKDIMKQTVYLDFQILDQCSKDKNKMEFILQQKKDILYLSSVAHIEELWGAIKNAGTDHIRSKQAVKIKDCMEEIFSAGILQSWWQSFMMQHQIQLLNLRISA